jgi:hypothetical protein
MKIVAIHQGHFLPWLGYWNKMVNANVFIWLDIVQFRKNYFQNRVYIKSVGGEKVWLTVPVSFSSGDSLSQVRIVKGDWKKKVLRTIKQHYMRAPFFNVLYPSIADIIMSAEDLLDDMNNCLFLHVKKLLGFDHVEVHKASSLHLTAEDPTQRLVDICRDFNATHYIAGKGGANYMNITLFEQAGISIIWQGFHENQPVYEQINGPFVSGLSIIDSLFNVGPEEVAILIRQSWSVKDYLCVQEHV